MLLLVAMRTHSSFANDLKNNRCKWNSKWTGCGQCCLVAYKKCVLYCVGCPAYSGSKTKDPCFIHENNKQYMKYFRSKNCGSKCGLPKKAGWFTWWPNRYILWCYLESKPHWAGNSKVLKKLESVAKYRLNETFWPYSSVGWAMG